MGRSRATMIGFTAVLMWALLALMTIGSAPVPPLQLNAMCFAIGGGIGLAWTFANGRVSVLRAVSWKTYAFGSAALFLYHLLYFNALRLAPMAETGLIAYLWPLFIVLFSGLLPGERLGVFHIIGALMAFGGAAMVVLNGGGAFDAQLAPGFALAFLCALTWAGYSVLSRRFGTVPTEAVTVYCLVTAALSALAHLGLEQTVWPTSPVGWAAVLGLGIGPVGAAFFTWDIGMKKGDIQLLGVASYAAPLLSTLALVVAGISPASTALIYAALLITMGAGLAAWASARAKDLSS